MLRGCGDFQHIGLFEFHAFRQSRLSQVARRRLQRVTVQIAAIKFQRPGRQLCGNRLFAHRIPCCRLEILEYFKCKMARDAGLDIERHLCRLDQERAAAAHRVEQRYAGLPVHQAQNARREIFADRGNVGVRTHAALEQRVARSVQIQHQLVVLDEHMDAHVRFHGVHAGPFAAVRAEAVAHGILDQQRDELQAFQRAADRGGIHAYGMGHIEPALPLQLECCLVDILLGAVLRFLDAPQDAAGDAALQIGPVTQRPVAGETHAAFGTAHILPAHLVQIGQQDSFQAARAGGEKIRHKSAKSERLDGDQDHDRRQDQHRNFVEPAVEHMAVGVPAGGELFDQYAAVVVIDYQQQHQK